MIKATSKARDCPEGGKSKGKGGKGKGSPSTFGIVGEIVGIPCFKNTKTINLYQIIVPHATKQEEDAKQ